MQLAENERLKIELETKIRLIKSLENRNALYQNSFNAIGDILIAASLAPWRRIGYKVIEGICVDHEVFKAIDEAAGALRDE